MIKNKRKVSVNLMQDSIIIDFIVMAALGVYIYTRFTGHKLPKDKKKPSSQNKTAKVVDFPKDIIQEKTAKPVIKTPKNLKDMSGIEQIKAMDPSFKKQEFLSGASAAYEMYYESFSEQDEETLEGLLSSKLYDDVMEKIDRASDAQQTMHIDVKKIEDVSIVDAHMHGRTAVIDVKYIVEQCDYTLDDKGSVVAGDKEKSKKDTVIWTWTRPVDTDDPNWDLEKITPVS